jgi:hypothetical protein
VHAQSGFCRVWGVTLTSVLHWSGQGAAETIAPYVVLPGTGWTLVVSLVAVGLLRLLAEWQLRRTLAEIFSRAPGGSVIIVRKRGLGGTMWIHVGSGHVPSRWPGTAELR